jgi:hypothetical protein
MKRVIILITLLAIFLSISAYSQNEKLTFEIKYGFIGAAEAVLSVEEITYTDTTLAWMISAKTKSFKFFDVVFKVRDQIVSYVNPSNGLPYEFIKNLKEGNYRQKREHSYDRETKTSLYRKWRFKHKYWKEKVIEIPEDTHDIFSAFYWTRQQDLAPGDTLSLSVTTDGVTAPIKIIVHERKKKDTIFGRVNCLKIEPIVDGETIFANSGKVYIWLTDDDEKIPVLLESKIIFGSFKAILRKAKNGTKPKK